MFFPLIHWFSLHREPGSSLRSLWCRKKISKSEAGLCCCLQNMAGNPAAPVRAGQRHHDTAAHFSHRKNLPQSSRLEVLGCLSELALCFGAASALLLLPQRLAGRRREILSSTKQFPILWQNRIWSVKHTANIWPSARQWIHLPCLAYLCPHTCTVLLGQTLHKHLSWCGVGLKGGIQMILQEEK